MNEILVSVIIPVYNVEKYLRQCVESVLAQTYHNLEIILIDDGSPDSCGTICDDYAEKDSRIKVIHQENRGMSAVRNVGVDNANGEYITFVDSDDFIAPQYIATLVRLVAETSAEISCVEFSVYKDSDRIKKPKIPQRYFVTFGPEYLEKLLYQTLGNSAVWGKLFKRDLFADQRFVEGIWYEDLDILYRILLWKINVSWCNARLYYYRKNPTSSMHTFGPRRLDVLNVTDRMVRDLSEVSPDLAMAARSRRLSAYFNIYCLLMASGAKDETLERKCIGVIKEERKPFVFNPKIRLKNKIGISITYLGGFRMLRTLAKLIY